MYSHMPWPFTARTAIGVDVGDRSIELVELVRRGSQITTVSIARTILNPGIVHRGRITDAAALEQAIRALFASAAPRPVSPMIIAFDLPECQVYTRIFAIPAHAKRDRERLVFEEAWKSIPVAGSELRFSYRTMTETKDRVEVLLVAAERAVVEEWQYFFQRMGIAIASIDAEIFAVFRAVIPEHSAPVCGMDCGAATTTIAVFDASGLRYAHTVRIAGDAITAAIATALHVSTAEAEERKFTFDLAGGDRTVAAAVERAITPLIAEATATLAYVATRMGAPVAEVVLVGGTSRLRGFPEYLQAKFGVPVRVGVPSVPLPSGVDGSLFSGAIGLALRGVDERWGEHDPEIPLSGELRAHAFSGAQDGAGAQVTAIGSAVDEGSDVAADSIAARDRAIRMRKRTLALFGVLLLGVAVLGLALVFRSRDRARRAATLEAGIVRYAETQAVELRVPIAVTDAAVREGRLRGRLLVTTIPTASEYAEAIAQARIAAEHAVAPEERFWGVPIDPPPNSSRPLSLPFTVRWLAYRDAEVNQFLESEIARRAGGADYAVSNIEKRRVEATADSAVFAMVATVHLAVHAQLPIAH